eukprot:gene908-1422_t
MKRKEGSEAGADAGAAQEPSCVFVKTQYQGDEDLRGFIDFLHHHDINNYIDLPEIAVMGDTSSGKSSLLSAISQIQLPSNDQLTTRCPLRLRMEKSETVKAQLEIKWHFSSKYAVSADTGLALYKNQRCLDEAAYPRTILDNWDEVPQEIEQAQQSILDRARGVDPHVAVVRDIVEVHVYGPQCTDLTLIDLPGIVRFTGDKESKTLGEDIKALINDYLINERCVILAVVPANVDFHNSEIMADAKKRTMPVITKPDLIDKGAERSVRDLLLGRKHQCYMGFHMVKLRGQKNLNEGVSLQFRSSHLVFYIAQQTSISDKK